MVKAEWWGLIGKIGQLKCRSLKVFVELRLEEKYKIRLGWGIAIDQLKIISLVTKQHVGTNIPHDRPTGLAAKCKHVKSWLLLFL